MTPTNNDVGVGLDVTNLAIPGSLVVAHRRISSPAVVVDVCNEEFVVECDDTEMIKESPSPSCDDGISMNFSISSLGEGVGLGSGGIFVTDSSASLPIYDCGDGLDAEKSKARSSFSNSVVGSGQILGVGGGGGGGKDFSPNIIHQSLGAGDSRASLISLGNGKKVRKDETWIAILSQIGLPFLIAGLGMVGAGLLLDYVMVCVWIRSIMRWLGLS